MRGLSRRNLLTGFQQKKIVIRPPWSLPESVFIDQCTRCGDCISACETKVIISGQGGYPELDFNLAECSFCQRCALICKAPVFNKAILSDNTTLEPWSHKVYISSLCLTTHKVTCRSCQDSCENTAIIFKLEAKNVSRPFLNIDSCNGCGACISSCPVNAISISEV